MFALTPVLHGDYVVREGKRFFLETGMNYTLQEGCLGNSSTVTVS